MTNIIKLEELLMFLFSAFLFSQTDHSWWLFFALILTPDIGMLGYLINTKVGAFTYNLFHHRGLAVVVLAGGMYFGISVVELAGIILFGHACMDRIFGYGLKFGDSFKNTHLGKI
ncbi:MAG: DUF4260 domain-containing protein [Cyclobacteriaceae bacterium]